MSMSPRTLISHRARLLSTGIDKIAGDLNNAIGCLKKGEAATDRKQRG